MTTTSVCISEMQLVVSAVRVCGWEEEEGVVMCGRKYSTTASTTRTLALGKHIVKLKPFLSLLKMEICR